MGGLSPTARPSPARKREHKESCELKGLWTALDVALPAISSRPAAVANRGGASGGDLRLMVRGAVGYRQRRDLSSTRCSSGLSIPRGSSHSRYARECRTQRYSAFTPKATKARPRLERGLCFHGEIPVRNDHDGQQTAVRPSSRRPSRKVPRLTWPMRPWPGGLIPASPPSSPRLGSPRLGGSIP
jgi:hypothetical protein